MYNAVQKVLEQRDLIYDERNNKSDCFMDGDWLQRCIRELSGVLQMFRSLVYSYVGTLIC